MPKATILLVLGGIGILLLVLMGLAILAVVWPYLLGLAAIIALIMWVWGSGSSDDPPSG